jgi:hypothetical protein
MFASTRPLRRRPTVANIRGAHVIDQRDARRRGVVLWVHAGGQRVRVAWEDADGRVESEDLDVTEQWYGVVVSLADLARFGLE